MIVVSRKKYAANNFQYIITGTYWLDLTNMFECIASDLYILQNLIKKTRFYVEYRLIKSFLDFNTILSNKRMFL